MTTKRLIIICLAFIFFSIGVYFLVDYFMAGEIKPIPLTNRGAELMSAPPTVAIDLNGKPVDLNNFKDKIVLVNFWASWCPPCVEEFPGLLRLVEDFKGEVILLAISNDDNAENARNFTRKYNLKSDFMYVIWDENQKLMDSYMVNKLPETFVFRKNGVFARRFSGFKNWHDSDIRKYMQSLVSK